MKEEISKKWVAALRGGEYKQGTGALRRTDNSFCCLGVLCDLYMKDTNQELWEEPVCRGHPKYYMYGKTGDLPDMVRGWAGIRYSTPHLPRSVAPFNDGLTYTSLIAVNDRLNYSFDQIADLVEQAGDEL